MSPRHSRFSDLGIIWGTIWGTIWGPLAVLGSFGGRDRLRARTCLALELSENVTTVSAFV